ncbi:MAG: undecaprenyl-diphosphate phosphatase [Actinobacteria bacterium]|nr:undecaprenyl-diphosphate phosphatase [Actinomycetota bacterium]
MTEASVPDPPDVRFGLGEALAYGLLQGPTELLPVSSSGHLVIAPWVIGSDYVRLDPELRKSFEVALHVGTAGALVIVLRDEVTTAVRELDGRRIGVIAASLAPPAIAALTCERLIERRLGRPEVVALGLVAGSAAMAWADRRDSARERGDAGWRDGLALGVAQALALIPGVSRSGSTIVAARARGFTPLAATELSMHAALPVIAGATVLKGSRLAKRGLEPGMRSAFAVGTVGAFASSLASAGLIAHRQRGRGLKKYVAYRLALAVAVTVAARRRSAHKVGATGAPARRLGSHA